VRAEPLEVYGAGLRAAASGAAASLTLRHRDGTCTPLHVARWVADSDAADLALLARAHGAVLDIGCGPGRLVASLGERGSCVLGIDIAADAVSMTHRRGALALRRSVFDRVPGAGRWDTALLLDGNVGIGGDPAALLRRVRQLVAPDGCVLLETADPDTQSGCSLVRVESVGLTSGWFPWATVSAVDVAGLAADAAFAVVDVWTEAGRWFAELRAH
jgi:SAM-dependent methyltransferase